MRTRNTSVPFANIHLIQSFLLKYTYLLTKAGEMVGKSSSWVGQEHEAGTGLRHLKPGGQPWAPGLWHSGGSSAPPPASLLFPTPPPPAPILCLDGFPFHCLGRKFSVGTERWWSKLLSCPARDLWDSCFVLMPPHGCSGLWGQIPSILGAK